MDTFQGLSQIASYGPKPAIGIGIVFALIVIAEIYLHMRRNRKKDTLEKSEIRKKSAEEVELKPLKFPEVPLTVSAKGLPSRKMTMVIVSVLAVVVLGGTGTLFLLNTETSIFSLGGRQETQSVPISLPTPTVKPTISPTPESVIVPTVRSNTQKFELIYYWVSENEWSELTIPEVLELPASQDVSIAVFTNSPHTGARFFINGRVYTTDPGDKNPFGYFYVTVPRSSFNRISDISASLLQ